MFPVSLAGTVGGVDKTSRWPVIALIIIGGLIIISVVWCVIRCCCCGLSCCCSCFSCLKCCGNCCGCCDPPRGSRSKYLDEPYIPPNHGYKSQEPMHHGFVPVTAPPPQPAKVPDFAQYATFDSGGKKNEDSLPQMPSWEGAEAKKVYLEEEAVEMNALKKPEAGGQTSGVTAIGGAVSPTGTRSPVNRGPYGAPGAGPDSNGFFAASAVGNDPYGQGAPAYNQPGAAYSEPEQGYGMAVAGMGPGRRSPQTHNNGGYNDPYNNNTANGGYGQTHDYPDPGRQGSYDNYGGAAAARQQQPYDNNNYDNYPQPTAQGAAAYNIARHQTPHNNEMDSTPYLSDPRRSPALTQGPYGPDARRSPAPQNGPGRYGSPNYGDARRSPGPGQYNNNPRRSPGPAPAYGAPRAPPQRQYTNNSSISNSDMHSSGPGSRSGPAPLRSDAGGFDFSSGYSRPPPAAATSPVHALGGGYRHASPGPAELQGGEQQQAAYPGYKPYSPA